MASVIILSGGVGVRLGGDVPKQYIEVANKPIIGYCLDIFQQNMNVSEILIVASEQWFDMLDKYITDSRITKFVGFALSGKSRQHSILNGLRKLKELKLPNETKVIIHDAARPVVSDKLIDGCVAVLDTYDCSMPVIPVKDTVYYSEDGKEITNLLNRDKLFAGQSPEGCHLGAYLEINEGFPDEKLELVRGTSSIAFENNLTVGLFRGDESNIKITTREDLFNFKLKKESSE